MRNLTAFLIGILFLVALSGCLKTRNQVRESEPVQNNVRDVEPRGEYMIEELKAEITRQNGRIEELERAQAEKTAGSANDKALEDRLAALEQTQLQILKELKTVKARKPSDPSSTFRQGKDYFQKGNFNLAIQSFTQYLKVKKGKHIHEATYLRGESYFATGKYQKAIIDFDKFTREYKNKRYQPKALFRIGRSFEMLGMKSDSVAFYQEVIDRFPKTRDAKDARKRLASQKSKKKKTKAKKR